ncbi:MAG: ribonuclease D [Microbacteriaceae bacterium]|nr:ribonuclease D [Microbacteriaceae bacterium]
MPERSPRPDPAPETAGAAADRPAAVAAAPSEHGPVIETRTDFLRAVERIAAGEGPTAIDAERASGFRYSQRAYLIQVFRRGAGSFLFDPPAIRSDGGDLHELDEAIGDGEWIIHAASQDLTCLREVGIDPRTLFDTELAARLLGMERVGLGAVVEELLGIHLEKAHSAVDWSIRPLHEDWLEYAALDVELLVDVRDALRERLVRDGKDGYAAEEFAATLERDFNPPKTDPWRRMSDLHTVRGQRNLAVARELWLARDAYAQEIDTAPGRLVPDKSLSAAARVLPASKRELAEMKEFNGRASRTQLDRWWAAIERGRTTEDLPQVRVPGDALPPLRAWAERNPDAHARLVPARESVAELAEQLSIPVENLLTPETLRRIAWAPPSPATPEAIGDALQALGARPWQIALTAQRISESFSPA